MSRRELKGLETGPQPTLIESRIRSGRVRMGDSEDQELDNTDTRREIEKKDRRIKELTETLTATESETETARAVAEEYLKDLERLRRELDNARVQGELETLRAVNKLHVEHQEAIRREKEQAEAERHKMEAWMAEVRANFEEERSRLQERVHLLERSPLPPRGDGEATCRSYDVVADMSVEPPLPDASGAGGGETESKLRRETSTSKDTEESSGEEDSSDEEETEALTIVDARSTAKEPVVEVTVPRTGESTTVPTAVGEMDAKKSVGSSTSDPEHHRAERTKETTPTPVPRVVPAVERAVRDATIPTTEGAGDSSSRAAMRTTTVSTSTPVVSDRMVTSTATPSTTVTSSTSRSLTVTPSTAVSSIVSGTTESLTSTPSTSRVSGTTESLRSNPSTTVRSTVATESVTPRTTVSSSLCVKPDTVLETMTKALQAQTEVMAAQARAAVVQQLPPLPFYTGEGRDACEDGFDRWADRFEERSRVAGWTTEQKLCQLKLHLDCTASDVFRMLPGEDSSDFDKALAALRKRFKPSDIEELRGLEFHHRVTQLRS